MKKIKCLFTGLLMGALLFSVTGCSGDTSWAVKTENDTVPAGVYLSYLMDAYSEAQGLADASKDLWGQTIEEVSAEQWIVNKAMKTTRQYVAVNLMFDELGMTMGTEGTNTAKTKADSYWSQYQKTYEQNGISYASVLKLAENDYKTQKIFDYFYETNGVEPVSEETIQGHFYDNYAKVKYLSVSRTKPDGTKIDEAELKKTVDGYITEINRGKNIDEVIDEYLTELYSDYGLSDYKPDTSDSDRNVTLLSKQQGGSLEGFVEKTFEQKEYNVPYSDDTSEGYIFLGARYDLSKDDELYAKNREAVLRQLRGEEYTQKLESRLESVKVTVNEEAVNRYSPRNIKLS